MGKATGYAVAITIAVLAIMWGRGQDKARCVNGGGIVGDGGPPFFWSCIYQPFIQ